MARITGGDVLDPDYGADPVGGWYGGGQASFNGFGVLGFGAGSITTVPVTTGGRTAERLPRTLRNLTSAGSSVGIRRRVRRRTPTTVAAQLNLATCRQPLGDLAHVAFQTLLQRIKSPLLPSRTVLLAAPLVAR